jgi:transcriptional regulator with XRE-family HTH domain
MKERDTMNKGMTPKDMVMWRNKMGLSQQQAAERLGYKDRSSICHFEKGSKPITPRITMLCELLMEKHDDKLAQRT